MLKIITIITLILSFMFHTGKTSDASILSEALDDSCIPRYSLDRIINIATTAGIYLWFSHDFKMMDTDWSDTISSCTDKAKEVKFTYQPSVLGLIKLNKDKVTLESGQTTKLAGGIVHLRAQPIADMLCVQWLMTLGWRTIGCKYIAPPSPPSSNSTNKCINSDLCNRKAITDSQSFLPLTGPLVECVRSALQAFFFGAPECDTLLNNFQQNMRKTVQILLIMYVMFFGIKVALTRGVHTGEAFLFLMKMLLVIYFSVGFSGNQNSNVGLNSNINDIFKSNGVLFIYDFFINAATELSQYAVTAGNQYDPTTQTSSLCVYDPSKYSNQHYIAWDYIDCRIGYYLGINGMAQTGGSIIATIASLLSLIMSPFIIISLIVLLFALLFIGIIIHVVHSFLISLIAITIVAFFAPIFVPMALFNQTKQMFQGWLSVLIANVIQPVVLMTFLAFMFSIMDNIVYSNCKFAIDTKGSQKMTSLMNAIGINPNNNQWVMWQIDPSSDPSCNNSFGYLIQYMGNFLQEQNQVGDFKTAISNASLSIISCIMFMFLFYFFIGMVQSMAADLGGAMSMSDGAIKPGAAFNKVGAYAGGEIKKAATKAYNKIKGNDNNTNDTARRR